MGLRRTLFLSCFAALLFSVGISYGTPPSNLPSGQVHATFTHYGPSSYWNIELSDVPPGYDVTNGNYVGWCVDSSHHLTNGATHWVTLYSSYELPSGHRQSGKEWPEVNWIINNKPSGMSIDDIQEAIWAFIDGGVKTGHPDDIQDLIDEADTHSDYEPGIGELLAVYVDADTDTVTRQGTFIEVTLLSALPLALGGAVGLAVPFLTLWRRRG